MYPNDFFGIKDLNLYTILIFVGIYMAMYMLRYQCRKGGVPDKVYRTYLLLGVVSILVGFLSAELFQSIYFWLETGVFEWRGLTFIGGLIGGIACFLLGKVIFIKGESAEYFGTICRYAIPCVLIAHAFGRIGCFFAGCCYGIETDSFLGVTFPGHSHKVFPTQLFESAFLFVWFFVCLKYNKYSLPLYFTGYGVFRFLIEFIRGDDRGSFIPGLSPSQSYCIIMLAVGIVMFLLPVIRSKIKKQQ